MALIDTNPVNWQALQKDFESLGVPITRSHAFFADGRWNIAEDGAFYSNFRTYAIKGARKVSSPQASDTDALHAWLTLLRQRVPRFWGFMTEVKSERRALALESIDPPSDDTALRQNEHFSCDLVLGVRPIGDRFVLINGLHRYLDYVNRRVASVTCYIDLSVYRRDGVLHDLREASIELCAQYETEADGVRLSRIASSAPPQDVSQLVTIKKAAELLKVHEDTVRKMGETGEIEILKFGPRRQRIKASEILRLRSSAKRGLR